MLYCARKLNFFSCVVDSYISSKGKIQTRRERERERDAANWMMDLYYLQVEFSNIQQPRKEQEEEEQPRRWHTWKPTAGWRKECATEALFRQ
jgi:hypothetical protein